MADEENKVAAGNSAESAAPKSVKKKTVKKAAKKAVKKKTVKKTAKKAVKKKSVKSATAANGNGQKAKIRLKDQSTPQATTTSKVKVPPKAEKDRLGMLSTLLIFMLLILGVWAIYSYMNEQEPAATEETTTEAVPTPATAPVAAPASVPAPEAQVIEEVVIAPVVEVTEPATVDETAPVAETVEVTDAVDQKDESKGFFESIFGRKDTPASNEADAAAEATQPAADPMAIQGDPFGPPPGFYDDMPAQGFGPPEGFGGPPPGFYDDMPPQGFGPPEGFGPPPGFNQPPQGFGPPPGFYDDMPPMPEYGQGRGW